MGTESKAVDSSLEMISWTIGDNPVELLKSVKLAPGVKYVLCEAVESVPVMKDDHGAAVTSGQILKAARDVRYADLLRKQSRRRDNRSLLDFQIAKAMSADIRDGDGDGMINDGTPQEQPVAQKPVVPPTVTSHETNKVAQSRVEAIREAASEVEFVLKRVDVFSDEDADTEESLDPSDRGAIDDAMEKWVDEQVDSYEPDISEYDIRTQLNLDDTGIASKIADIVGDEDITQRVYEGIGSGGGVDAIDEAIEVVKGLSLENEEEVLAEINNFRTEAQENINTATDEAYDQARDEYRSDITSTEEYWNKRTELIYENAPDGDSSSGVWGIDGDADDAYMFKVGEESYKVNVLDKEVKVEGKGSVPVDALMFNSMSDGSYSITGKAGARGAIEVFNNVMTATAAWVMEKKPPVLYFSAEDSSRQRLYDRLASSVAAVGGDYKVISIQAKEAEATKYYVAYNSDMRDAVDVLIEEKMKSARWNDVGVEIKDLVKALDPNEWTISDVVPATENDFKLWGHPKAWAVPLEQLRAMRSKAIMKAMKPGQDPRDGDGDGKIFDGTPQERPARDNVGRVVGKDKVDQAAKSPGDAAKLMSRTTRPAERAKLVQGLKRAGMSEESIAEARKAADDHSKNISDAKTPADLYRAEDKMRTDPKMGTEQSKKLNSEIEAKAKELREKGDSQRPNTQQNEPNKASEEKDRGRVLFEAAPDPNDKELTDQWRGLKDEDRVAISRDVVNAVMPEVAAKIGVDVSIQEQLGGYLDDTNPSFAATFNGPVDPSKFIETMKAAGFAMSQDSMMGISPTPIEGAEKVGFVTVNLAGADAHETYMKIRSMDSSVQGHTTIGDRMTIVDFTGRSKEIADLVSSKLGLDADDSEGYAAFIEKKDYGHGTKQSGSESAPSDAGQTNERPGAELAGGWSDTLRGKASSIIRDGIAAAKSGQQPAGGQPAASGGKVDGPTADQSGSQSTVGDWSKVGNFALTGEADAKGNASLAKGLQVERHKLPQVRNDDQPELLDWLGSQGVGVSTEPFDPSSMLPVQSQVNKAKIDKMIVDDRAGEFDISKNPVMISRDGYLIDGHHRAIASAAIGKQMTGLKVDLDAKDLLKKLEEFPKTFSEGINENRNAPDRDVILPMEKAVAVLQSKPWRDYAEIIPDNIAEMSKLEMKATIASLPEPPRGLPNNPSLYFNTSEADFVVDVEAVDLADIPGNPPGAEKLMAAAALGKTGKRAPVDAAMRDGKLMILDGKSTASVAAKHGMHLAVKMVENDPSQWFSSKEKMTEKRPLHSAQKSYGEHAKAAVENMDGSEDSFLAVLDLGKGLSRAIGAKVPTYPQALDAAKNKSDNPMVIVGPVKTAESSGRKVNSKYNGDFSRLTDVIRATVVVPRYAQIGPAMSAMKSELAQRGWTVVEGSGENKFVTPTSAGYRDVSMLIKAPNGQIAEIQVNTSSMWYAKETDGHKLYEQSRLLDAKKDRTPEESAELDRLLKAQSDLYSKAWEDSQ